MQRNSSVLVCILMLGVLLASVFLPFSAAAYIIPTNNIDGNAIGSVVDIYRPTGYTAVCPGEITSNPYDGFAARLIPCIRDSIIWATNSMFNGFLSNFTAVIDVAMVMAIMFYGISVLLGKGSTQGTVMLLLKIGAISYFIANFLSYYPIILTSLEDILDKIATIATAPFASGGLWRPNPVNGLCPIGTNFAPSETKIMTVWNILDCYIDLLIGGVFTPTIPLANTVDGGILKFIVSTMFSSSSDFIIGAVGFLMLALFIFVIAKAIYIFITSYIAFSFMVLVSSIFVPLILFQSTKKYFDAWLTTTLGFLIQPIFVFAYLVIFMMASEKVFFNFGSNDSVMETIVGVGTISENFGARFGNLLSANGVYTQKLQNKADVNVNPTQLGNEIVGQIPIEQTNVAGNQGNLGGTKPNYGQNGTLTFFEMGMFSENLDFGGLAAAAAGGPVNQAAINQYKMNVFLSLFTAAIVMYIFYSLLDYLPYIGSGSFGGVGISGIGMPAAPSASKSN